MSELYTLPDGWEWKKLGDITTVIGGGTPRTNIKEYWENGNIIWLSPTDLGNIGEIISINNSKTKITKLGLEKSSAKLLPIGTVLFSSRATIGKIAINEIEVSTNQGFTNFICKNLLLNKYLAFCLNRFTSDITDLSNSTTFKEVSKSSLKDFKIPLPPLEEQKRIVAKLDILFAKIDKAIALHQKNIDEADIFMASVLNDVFVKLEEKYEKKVWNEILTIKNGKHYKDVIDENGKYPIYGSGGIMNYANNYICNEDTVIIGRKGTINSPIFVKEKFWNIDTAFGIEANRNFLIPIFLFYFTKYFNFLDLNKSTTLPSLAKTHLLQINMVVPPLPTQQKVVSYLDEISEKMEKIKNLQKDKMQSLKELKASILDKAFKGEL